MFNEKGFTLIEVMLAVAILSLGTVFISQSNMMSLEVYSRYTRRLAVQAWAGEKVWETKQAILESPLPETGVTTGTFSEQNQNYHWQLEVGAAYLDEIYSIRLDVSWRQARGDAKLSRFAFVQKQKKKA